jgi:hypothetical protein
MEEFALYLFKSVVWLAGFTMVFILFLKNERFFLLNRIYLIAGIITSFILPLISIHYTVVLPAIASYQISSSVSSGNQIVQHSLFPDIKTILFALYFTGVGFVVLLAVRQGRSVFRAIKKSEVIALQPVKLLKTPEYTSAFSFFSYVFVNPSVTDVETKEIMIHELVHIRQKHWFDLLLVELLRIMQWFNPLVWIYVRFIRQNHEYLADEVALQQTSDPAIYKAVLLNQIVGAPVISLSNSFNYSPNKKRFYMMKNIITSPYRKMKVLLILPVFAFVLFAFAKPDYKYKYADQNANGIVASDTLKHSKGLPPPPPPPPPMPENIDNKGFAPPPPPPVPSGPDSLGVPPPPPPPRPMHTSFDNISIPPPHLPAVITNFDGSKALYVVDGVIVTEEELAKIDQTAIESINVTKSPSTKYGEKGKNGVVEITLRKNSKESDSKPTPPFQVRSDSGKKPLIIVDGTISDIDLKKTDPETIKSVTVLTDKTATDKYGEKAKDGALEIITKTGPVNLQSKNLLYVVDGVVKDDISLIDPNSIESISVLKGGAAELYGAKDKDGVIVITLKKDISVNPVIKTSEKVNVVNDVTVVKDFEVKKDVPVKK